MNRSLDLDDERLLAECEVDTYRASGPGGQKRNKRESAVRLRHLPTGVTVIAEESRSQAENRARALRRLRKALTLKLRGPLDPSAAVPREVAVCIDPDGRLVVGPRDARFLPAAAAVLDVLLANSGSVAAAARRLGISTGNLSSFLASDADLLEEANRLRASFGLRRLRR